MPVIIKRVEATSKRTATIASKMQNDHLEVYAIGCIDFRLARGLYFSAISEGLGVLFPVA